VAATGCSKGSHRGWASFSRRIATFISLIVAVLAGVAGAADSPPPIGASAVVRLAQDRAPERLIFLDASPQVIYERVRITGALRASELDAAKRPLPLSASLVIYDLSLGGNGASEASRLWIGAGYQSVHVMRGGFGGVHDAKIPLDTAAPFADVLPYTITAASLADALKQKENLVIVDLRSDVEFSAKHIPGALSVKASDLLSKATAWDKTAWIVLYDSTGNALDPLIWQLRKSGFLQAVSLSGGYRAWDREQGPRHLDPITR